VTEDVVDHLKSALADRYQIDREIGRGGMATVYLALDLKHDRPVAVKVMHPELVVSLGADRFLREIQIEARFQHPHIVPLYDSGQADGLLYYVMPYVEGETLRARIAREGQLPVEDALQITCEVGAALTYAHSHGVVHRDIKPENILLSTGEAMVADFGIARAISAAGGSELTGTGISLGTPEYMSPEQASGEQRLDGRSDLYSLGCVLYEMLGGDPPFTGQTAQAVLARHRLEDPPPIHVVRPTIPRTLGATLERALAKVPADRFATTSEFVTKLETTAPSEVRGVEERPDTHVSGPTTLAPLREPSKRMLLYVGLAYMVFAWRGVEFTRALVAQQTIEPWVTPVVVLFLTLGLAFLLVTAWAWEKAPPLSATTVTGRLSRWARKARPGRLLSVLAVLVIALLAGQSRLVRAPPNGPAAEARSALDPTRIAVLPFEDESEAEEFGHLALVFPQYLLDQLSRLDALTILPYAAVKRYYRADAPLDSVVRDLRAGTLIEGTIIGSEDEVRVLVQLFDANRLALLHSEQHARPREEMLALLDDLTNDVVTALRQELGVVVRDLERMAGTESDEAWEFYARGREWAESARELWEAGGSERALQTYDRADSAFARAQAIDAAWIDPIVERGWAMYQQARMLKEDLRSRDPAMLRRGIELADSALERDPRSARALDLRGTLRYWLRETADDAEAVELREGAEQDLEASTNINPTNAHAWDVLANVLRVSGRHVEAKQAAERALEADQFYEQRRTILARLCHTSLESRDWDEVMHWCEAGLQEFPGYRLMINAQLLAFASAGGPEPDVARVWQLFDDFLDSGLPGERQALRPSALLYVADVLARAGLADSARAVIRQARAAEIKPDPMNDYNEAYTRLLLGERDEALRLLARHLQARPGRKEYIATEWWWDSLRNDPRFLELLR
jgi:TolB-like protein/tRNA A-37 threonylcarbamoyl transferase component Bud32